MLIVFNYLKVRVPAAPVAVLAAAAITLTAIFLWLTRTQPLDHNVPEVVALMLAAGALYLTSVYIVFHFDLRSRSALMIVLGAALLFRIILYPLPPSLSHDLYRYQWEGSIQLEGFNPYLHAPSAADVAHLRPPDYRLIPGRDVPAAYGPVVELVFRGAALFGGLAAFKLVSLLFDLLSLLFLVLLLRARGDPPARAIVYAWCPLVALEFAGQGHNDSLMMAFLLLGLLLLQTGKNSVAGIPLTAAILAKWTAGLLLPLAVRKAGWRVAPAAIGTAVLLLLPYHEAGAGLFSGLGIYAQQWRNNAGLFGLIGWFTGEDRIALGVAAGVTAGLALFLAWKKTDAVRAAYLIMAALLLLAPSVFPWYLTWLVPFLAFYPNPALLLWTVTVTLSYHIVIGYSTLGLWNYNARLTALQYVPVIGLLLWTSLRNEDSAAVKTS